MLGWKTFKYYYETDEPPTPNAKPNPRKNQAKSGIWATFFATANNFSLGWDWFYIGNRLQET